MCSPGLLWRVTPHAFPFGLRPGCTGTSVPLPFPTMLRVDPRLTPDRLQPRIQRLWAVSGEKLRRLVARYDLAQGAPVFTREGRYVTQGWTEWTLGFHFGSALLQFDATGDDDFLEMGRTGTAEHLVNYLTHTGVHDHGFNIVSTFGNLWRLAREGRFAADRWELRWYETALRCSAAVQAHRWTPLRDGGYIHSFNGPHSLFADTMRTLRVLALGHLLGHVLLEEEDRRVSLLERLLQHARTTCRYNVYYGTGRDIYDVRGRVAHEAIFNVRTGSFRCPSSQQGWSPWTTWTRALAWILLGCAEQLEFLAALPADTPEFAGEQETILGELVEAARATADYYIASSPANGIPYWDTQAPGPARLAEVGENPADPFNDEEPVDSSAGAIAAQGLLRLGHFLLQAGLAEEAERYRQAGLTVAAALLNPPYLSEDVEHEGLLLHSVYHRPRGWDHVPPGRRVPCGEATQWGDYHLRELALYVQRLGERGPYLTFWANYGAEE